MTDRLSTRATVAGSLALVGGGFVASALAWSSLPAEMAIHWDASGTADNFASRAFGALLLPALALGMLGLFVALPRIDPLGANFEQFRDLYNGFVLFLVGFLIAIHGAVLATNLGYDVGITIVTVALTGVFLAYVGLLLRAAEPNWFVGIRTPWTLSSETVWERTHEMAGTLFVLVGLVTVVVSIVALATGLEAIAIYALVAGSLVAGLLPAVYSYYLYERLDRPGDRPEAS